MPIDMLAHLFPLQGQTYPLIGAGSNETCRTRYTPSGYGYFDKNENWEEGWGDERYVYRAFDISSFRHNEVYALWTKLPDGTLRYGSAWTPRYMDVGQIFKRTAWVIHYDAAGNIKKQQQVITYLKLVAYHANKTFPSGRTVQGVAELQYGFSPNVADVREHYFYGLGLGLVGFEDGVMATFIGQGTPTTIKPQTDIAWINKLRPAVPPKESAMPDIPAPTQGGVKGIVVSFPQGVPFRNLRTQPVASADDIGDLKPNEDIIAYTAALVNGWCYIDRLSDHVKGWVLWQGVVFAPELLPPAEKTYSMTEAERLVLLDQLTRSIADLTAAKALVEGLAPSNSGGL